MSIEFKLGSTGDAVADIQRKLASLSNGADTAQRAFFCGPCNGIYDEAMEQAVVAFKASHGLVPLDPVCNEATWRKLDEEAGSVFAETWQFELDALRGASPPKQVRPADKERLTAKVHHEKMAGLALSGGGIRSATFNLGVMQAMAEMHLLRDFDYLSTVSGGGYIGAWFSKWLSRLEGRIEELERKLMPGSAASPVAQEPDEIRFLRQYSNYLTPKTGMFSADTWAILATYIRNTLLNLAILVALMGAVLILPRMLALYVETYHAPHISRVLGVPISIFGLSSFTTVAIAAVLWSVFWIAVSISTVPDRIRTTWIRGQSQVSIIWGIVIPLMFSAFMGSIALWEHCVAIGAAWDKLRAQPTDLSNPILVWLVAPGTAYFLVWAAGWLLAQWYNRDAAHREQWARGVHPEAQKIPWGFIVKEGIGHFVCAIAALAGGVTLVIMLAAALAKEAPSHLDDASIHIVAFGIPVFLILFGLTTVLSVGLVGRMYTDKSREWWSRQGGWTSIFVMAWLAVVAVSLYAPALVSYAQVKSGNWAAAIFGTGWFTTTLAGLLIGRSKATGKKGGKKSIDLLASIAPLVFSIGALFMVSTLIHALTTSESLASMTLNTASSIYDFFSASHDETLHNSSAAILLTTLVCLSLFGVVLAWRVDINKFSLHMMYRNRLVRAYLGASNTKRQPHPFTGFDQNDDVHFDELLQHNGKVQRPYHIVNTALNLVNGEELAWQTRKAAAFSFSPAFCGFELPSMATPGGPKIAGEGERGAYRRTDSYRTGAHGVADEEPSIRLGMAMSISGAAASPSMGYHSSPPLAFLMTLFNVRLGRWFANPCKREAGHAGTSPRIGLAYLISELFGQTDSDSEYLYLSDGGHFENLGLYELVRRRCRMIVVVDASADGKLDFGDLGNAIRKCSTDLRIEIEIDVGAIDVSGDDKFSRAHCVKGTIHYERVDRDAPAGTLLYIKPSLLGKECAEVLNYRKTNAAFPHETTADQWFDETQFESYRSLGYWIAKIALGDAAAAAMKPGELGHDVEKLCDEIDKKWGEKRRRPGGATIHQMPAKGDRRHNDRRSA
ncbi:MAG: peptidoglycan-binding protein [Massilia sp.]